MSKPSSLLAMMALIGLAMVELITHLLPWAWSGAPVYRGRFPTFTRPRDRPRTSFVPLLAP